MNLEAITAALTLPGMPAWTGLAALLVLFLLGAAFLVMPFSVFGVKSRQEAMEAQLDEMHAELRVLSARLAEAPRRVVMDELEMPQRPVERPGSSGSGGRSEPRINWPGERR